MAQGPRELFFYCNSASRVGLYGVGTYNWLYSLQENVFQTALQSDDQLL